jgi:hypothetical protein
MSKRILKIFIRTAVYPSGKGTDCSSVLPGSTPGAASIDIFHTCARKGVSSLSLAYKRLIIGCMELLRQDTYPYERPEPIGVIQVAVPDMRMGSDDPRMRS